MSFNPSLTIITIVALTFVSPAAATGFVTSAVVDLNGVSHLRYERTSGPQKVSGSISDDLGHATPGWNATYSFTASARGLAITSKTTGHVPNENSHLVGGEVHLQSAVEDTVTITGSNPGQRLAWHRSMKIAGNTEFIGSTGKEANAFYNALYNFRIIGQGDFDIDPGPYLGFVGVGLPTFATGTHIAHNGLRPYDIVRAPQPRLDYTMYITTGQDTVFDIFIDLLTDTILNADASATLTQGFNVNFDTGPGFFTLVGNDGRDTGVRFDPHGDPNFKITSASGFNYLALAGEGGGAVPEPASWALMLAGFGATGGAIRMSKRKMRTSCC